MKNQEEIKAKIAECEILFDQISLEATIINNPNLTKSMIEKAQEKVDMLTAINNQLKALHWVLE